MQGIQEEQPDYVVIAYGAAHMRDTEDSLFGSLKNSMEGKGWTVNKVYVDSSLESTAGHICNHVRPSAKGGAAYKIFGQRSPVVFINQPKNVL